MFKKFKKAEVTKSSLGQKDFVADLIKVLFENDQKKCEAFLNEAREAGVPLKQMNDGCREAVFWCNRTNQQSFLAGVQ